MPGLSESARSHYPTCIARFCEFTGKTPDRIIAERKRHLRSLDERTKRIYERKVLEFYDHAKKSLKLRESSAWQMVTAVRGWFARNYGTLDFARRGPRRPKTEPRDYIPPVSEVREIVECSNVRDKAIFLTMLQTGLGPADICELKRGWFERVIKAGDYPALIAEVSREKTRCSALVCIGADAGHAIKRYLDQRDDSSPYLFVELKRKVLTRDEKGNPKEWEVQQLEAPFIDVAFQKAVKRAGVQVPNGLRLRCYALRKIFETQAGRVMPQPWVDLSMGHQIAGARAAYIKPNGDEFLEAYRRAEPLLSITETVPTEKKIEAMVGKRTGELERVVEERSRQLQTLLSENKELKANAKGLERRIRTLEFLEARRLGLSVPELRELSADQAELIRRLKKLSPEWVAEE